MFRMAPIPHPALAPGRTKVGLFETACRIYEANCGALYLEH
jgi:hypothetical protein